MKRLLLFASKLGYQTRQFAEAGRRLGYEVVLATDRCGRLDDPWGDRALPVKFGKPSASWRVLADAGPFDGVIAVGDRPAVLAAEMAARLGVPFHSPQATAAGHDKHLARELLRRAGLPVPRFFRVALDADPAAVDAPFPCVLKPLGMSASRGVIRADDRTQLVAAFRRIRALLETPEVKVAGEDVNRFVQIEEYIPGAEYAIEAVATRGRLRVFAIFDKPDPLEGPYFEETIYVTPSRAPEAVQRELIAAAESAARAMGMTHGPVHAELRHNERGAWVLEVAGRPIGGLCARAVRFAGGATLEEVLLRHAAGEDVAPLRPLDEGSAVLMIPVEGGGMYEGVDGVDEARAVPGIDHVEITAFPGQYMLPWPEGSSYLGFVFARAATPAAAEAALREAWRRLRFRFAAALPVLGGHSAGS